MQHYRCETPVAFFIFNRPDTARRVFDAIAYARPARLLVVADGPRQDRPGEERACRETRAIVDAVDWPCTVQTHYSDVNLGCRRRLASGLDWVFAQTGKAIVLEDDCLPDPSFFPFCEQMLVRFADDQRINMIRGTNFLFGRRFTDASYYFSRFYNTWGWATWARAWQHYDVEMRAWPELRDTGWLERQLPKQSMVAVVRDLFDGTYEGRYSTWDYQWALAGWLHNQVAITPTINLVSNIGYGADATTTVSTDSPMANLPTSVMTWPLVHPPSVALLQAADLHEWKMVYENTAYQRSWRKRLKALASRWRRTENERA